MVSARFKATLRLFKKHLARFFTIVMIVIVSVGFTAGLGEIENQIKIASNTYYKTHNVSDLYLKSNLETGFSSEDLAFLKEKFGEENLLESFCYEEKQPNGEILRIYRYDLSTPINQTDLKKGALPVLPTEAVAMSATETFSGYAIGEKITLSGTEYVVSGSVVHPLLLCIEEQPSFQFDKENLSNVLFLQTEALATVNDVYVTLENRELFDSFSESYERTINRLKAELSAKFGESVSVLSLYENNGFYAIDAYAEKVGQIALVFAVFFLLVTLLVVYSTISRLLDEERAQIACMKTLGYTEFQAVKKYLFFALLATLVGGAPALGIGLVLTRVVYNAFNMQYFMPPFPTGARFEYFAATYTIVLVGVLVLSLCTALNTAKRKPVALLSPKSPKAGKKVLMEKITFLWKRLSFKHKSTMRNVFLFKSRFFMTVISVLGSTVLVLSGMGLLDCSLTRENAASIIAISVVLIAFSAVLCALVVYNIANINVSERTREIATLMVLGYHEKEVTGYIFREIYVMSFIGAILGIPFGIVFLEFVFSLIDFGTLAEINWWTWLLTPVLTMFFTFLSTKLLYRKITKTDMNASLKTLE